MIVLSENVVDQLNYESIEVKNKMTIRTEKFRIKSARAEYVKIEVSKMKMRIKDFRTKSVRVKDLKIDVNKMEISIKDFRTKSVRVRNLKIKISKKVFIVGVIGIILL